MLEGDEVGGETVGGAIVGGRSEGHFGSMSLVESVSEPRASSRRGDGGRVVVETSSDVGGVALCFK